MKKKIRFLHICRDDKFLKGVINGFSNMTDDITSEYVILKKKGKKMKYVDEEVLNAVYTSKKFLKEKMQKGDYEVVYFHSLPPENYWMIKHIPEDKIVIWWAWGFDIYNGGIYGWHSFVNTDSIKPKTKKTQNQSRPLIRKVALFFCMLYFEIYSRLKRDSILKRIDYFRPVLPVEYDLMKKNKEFKAKEFYPLNYGPNYHVKMTKKNMDGNIIIGNSASAFNNHIDVWEDIKSFVPTKRRVLIPLSYGTVRYAKKVKTIIKGENVSYLDKFLPKEDYFEIMNRCSYAVYGSIRQHAMGNIFHALSEGMKIFLYKDSIIYQYLKSMGFVVFAIEDIDKDSFTTPITNEELLQNEHAFDKIRNYSLSVKTNAMRQIEAYSNLNKTNYE